MKGTVYLIPCPIDDSLPESVLPEQTLEALRGLDYYIVENEKTARRFLSAANHPKPIRELAFELLNKHTTPEEISTYLQPVLEGKSVGIISEAGCPGVADPGAVIVELAHQKGINVVPLIGPSSILLALMASGFSGQSFSFVGYLPKEKNELKKRITDLENQSKRFKQTQIFIETPFRNNQLLENLIQFCQNNTKISVAANIGSAQQQIKTLSAGKWKGQKLDLHKIPTVFSIYAA